MWFERILGQSWMFTPTRAGLFKQAMDGVDRACSYWFSRSWILHMLGHCALCLHHFLYEHAWTWASQHLLRRLSHRVDLAHLFQATIPCQRTANSGTLSKYPPYVLIFSDACRSWFSEFFIYSWRLYWLRKWVLCTGSWAGSLSWSTAGTSYQCLGGNHGKLCISFHRSPILQRRRKIILWSRFLTWAKTTVSITISLRMSTTRKGRTWTLTFPLLLPQLK